MNRAIVLLPLLLSGCAGTPARNEVTSTASSRATRASGVVLSETLHVDPLPEPAAPIEASAARPASPAPPDDLELWRDPEFKRRFAESYIAETETEPSLTEADRQVLQAAAEKISAGNTREASVLLEKQCGPTANAQFDLMLANLHFQQDEYEVAIRGYREAVRKYPRFRRAWSNLGLCHARLGQYREAAQAIARVIELGGGSAVNFGLLGIAHANLGDPLAAESAFRMAMLLDPSSNDWKTGLAESLYRGERFADTVALCRTLIEADPERAELWLLQANAYARLQRPLEAAQNLEMVDRLGKSTPESLFLLGDIYTNDELYDMAAGAYERAMEAGEHTEKGSSSRPERALRAAQGLAARGDHDGTARLVERIETLYGERLDDKQRRDLLHLRVRVAVARGAGGEEVRALEEIVALDPLDGEALLLLGQHAKDSGEPEKAVFYYERAEQLEAFEADAKVRHAQLLVSQGKYAEALPLLRRAQNLKPRENVQEWMEQVERAAGQRGSATP